MATRAKYYRVPAEKGKEDKPETDIIMKFSQTYGRYVTRGLKLFFGEGKSMVKITAADRLIDRALWVAEVIKRRVQGLHQIIQIKEQQVTEVFEPKQEGLVRVERKRYLTVIEVTLTKEPTAEQKKAAGYQVPTKSSNAEYLTKEAWKKQQEQREERIKNRESRPRRQNNNQRGQFRKRGRR